MPQLANELENRLGRDQLVRNTTVVCFYHDSLAHAYLAAGRVFAHATGLPELVASSEDAWPERYSDWVARSGQVFAPLMERCDLDSDRVAWPIRTDPVSLQDPEREVARRQLPELTAVEDVRRWLNVSYAVVAQIAGLTPSLIHYWKMRQRRNARIKPRAVTVERLYSVHAVLKALAEALDGDDGSYAVQLWARDAGDYGVSPLQLLTQGRIEDVQRLARPLLFDVSLRQPPVHKTVPAEDLRDEDPYAGRDQPPLPELRSSDFE
jgi:hypothetical protein